MTSENRPAVSHSAPALHGADLSAERSAAWRPIASAPRNLPFLAVDARGELRLCWRHNPSSRTDEIVTLLKNGKFKATHWKWPPSLPGAPASPADVPPCPGMPQDPSAAFVLVPREPTEEMLATGELERGFDEISDRQGALNIYRAMISAAPAQEPSVGWRPERMGREITFSRAEAGIGEAVISPDDHVPGCYWTLIGGGEMEDQNALAELICGFLNSLPEAPR